MPNLETIDLNRLPYSNPEFSDIRDENMVYVDKTGLIAKIADQRGPIFFSRPRRFGKSLLINTLASLFTDGLKYFHGLEIEKIWNDKTYQVVHIDFSRMKESNSYDFKFKLSSKIINQFEKNDNIIQSYSTKMQYPDVILDEILQKLNNKSIVLLIDEYDAPLTHIIDEPDRLNDIKNIFNF